MAAAELIRRRQQALIGRFRAAIERGETEEFVRSLSDSDLDKLISIFGQMVANASADDADNQDLQPRSSQPTPLLSTVDKEDEERWE